jgi:hypothetical protein
VDRRARPASAALDRVGHAQADLLLDREVDLHEQELQAIGPGQPRGGGGGAAVGAEGDALADAEALEQQSQAAVESWVGLEVGVLL